MRLDLDKLDRDFAWWEAQEGTGPLTQSAGFRALLRASRHLLSIALAAAAALPAFEAAQECAMREEQEAPDGEERLAALRAALDGRGMNATPPLGTHARDCYDDPAHPGPCRVVRRAP